MREFVERMVRQRLEDLPLVGTEGEPRRLPDDAIDYLMSVVEWAVTKSATPANPTPQEEERE